MLGGSIIVYWEGVKGKLFQLQGVALKEKREQIEEEEETILGVIILFRTNLLL